MGARGFFFPQTHPGGEGGAPRGGLGAQKPASISELLSQALAPCTRVQAISRRHKAPAGLVARALRSVVTPPIHVRPPGCNLVGIDRALVGSRQAPGSAQDGGGTGRSSRRRDRPQIEQSWSPFAPAGSTRARLTRSRGARVAPPAKLGHGGLALWVPSRAPRPSSSEI